MMLDAFLDALIDCIKMLPILYLAYLLMELFEHRAGEKTCRIVSKVGRAGPIAGSLLGLVPQCGFSGAVAGFFAAGIVTLGTVFAVFIATSDEMLPILLSSKIEMATILKILLFKFLGGLIIGFIVDIFYRKKKRDHHHGDCAHKDIHSLCEREHCSCHKQNIFLSALIHSLKVLLMIFVVSLALNLIFAYGGEEVLKNFVLNKPILAEMTVGLIGLIPNCSASVLITNLYVGGAISVGAMMAGLMANAGVGLIVLFRLNKSIRQNIVITALLYVFGVLGGIITGFVF